MSDTNTGPNGRVFISCSPKDKGFVQKLNTVIAEAGIQSRMDGAGIELASGWMKTITQASEGNDAFLLFMSANSLESKVCADELALNPSDSIAIWDPGSIRLMPRNERIAFACSPLISNLSQELWTGFCGDEAYRPICPDLPTPVTLAQEK